MKINYESDNEGLNALLRPLTGYYDWYAEEAVEYLILMDELDFEVADNILHVERTTSEYNTNEILNYIYNHKILNDLYITNSIIHACVDNAINNDFSVDDMLMNMIRTLTGVHADLMDELLNVQLRSVIDFKTYE